MIAGRHHQQVALKPPAKQTQEPVNNECVLPSSQPCVMGTQSSIISYSGAMYAQSKLTSNALAALNPR